MNAASFSAHITCTASKEPGAGAERAGYGAGGDRVRVERERERVTARQAQRTRADRDSADSGGRDSDRMTVRHPPRADTRAAVPGQLGPPLRRPVSTGRSGALGQHPDRPTMPGRFSCSFVGDNAAPSVTEARRGRTNRVSTSIGPWRATMGPNFGRLLLKVQSKAGRLQRPARRRRAGWPFSGRLAAAALL